MRNDHYLLISLALLALACLLLTWLVELNPPTPPLATAWPTATSTPTATVTSSPTATHTATLIPTQAPTSTLTPTVTSTRTPTPTFVPTATRSMVTQPAQFFAPICKRDCEVTNGRKENHRH